MLSSQIDMEPMQQCPLKIPLGVRSISPSLPHCLVAQSSNFQWTAALNAAVLMAGWQDHLTQYVASSWRWPDDFFITFPQKDGDPD